jgi:hypothetical protein
MQAELRASNRATDRERVPDRVALRSSFSRIEGRAEGLRQASGHQLRALLTIGTSGYFVEWDDALGVPVFILAARLRPV